MLASSCVKLSVSEVLMRHAATTPNAATRMPRMHRTMTTPASIHLSVSIILSVIEFHGLLEV